MSKVLKAHSNLFGHCIYIVDGDIYKEYVDVIVQESNKYLLYNGFDILKLAGEKLKNECKE